MAEKWLYDEKPIDEGAYIGAFWDPDTGICYTMPIFYESKVGWHRIPYAWTHLPNAPKHPDWLKK